MHIFVRQGAGILIVRLERAAHRHLDIVADRRVIGLVSAMSHSAGQGSEERVDRGAMHAFDPRFGRCCDRIIIGREAVDLIDVKNGIGPQETDILRGRFAGHPIGIGLREARIIDAVGAALAAPDLPAQFGGLAIGHPVAARIALCVADRPEIESVDAGIGCAAMAERTAPCSGQAPGSGPGENPRFQLGDDKACDLGRDVAARSCGFACKGHGDVLASRPVASGRG